MNPRNSFSSKININSLKNMTANTLEINCENIKNQNYLQKIQFKNHKTLLT